MAEPSTSTGGFDLQRKLGPLPVWAWALIGVAVGYYIYKRQQASAATSNTAVLPPSTTPATLTGTAGTATPATQGSWETNALQGAISAGYNPTEAENALANWQNGQPLSSTQEGILNWILSNVGPSPNGVQPVYTGTLPPPQGAPTQTTGSQTFGFGQENIGGSQYTILGVLSGGTPSAYQGYDVKAGTPVYYLAPGSSTPAEGSSEVKQGSQILVPSIYDQYVSPTATHHYSG